MDYYPNSNSLAATQHSEDPFIIYFLTSFILFCAFPLFMYFKDGILWTFSSIRDSIHCISLHITYIFNALFNALYTIWKELKQLQPQDQHFQQPRTRKALIQIPPPLDDFLIKVREQLTVFSSTEQASPIQEIQQECSDSQVFETEQLFLHTPNVFIERTYSPPVICNDCLYQICSGKERCLKFINQDLTFLQSSSIPSHF